MQRAPTRGAGAGGAGGAQRPAPRGRAPRAPRAAAPAGGGPDAAAAPSCFLSPLGRTLDFPHRGSGLLWARSTGLKLWPGAMLLARTVAEADGALLASLHPALRGGGGGSGGDSDSSAAAPRRPRWRGWRDARVLELGCGLGAVSSAAAWLGARVVATDGDADLLRVRARPACMRRGGGGVEGRAAGCGRAGRARAPRARPLPLTPRRRAAPPPPNPSPEGGRKEHTAQHVRRRRRAAHTPCRGDGAAVVGRRRGPGARAGAAG
jgi:hypothetical protein